MKFRYHKSGLEVPMLTTIEVADIDELKKVLEQQWEKTIDGIEFRHIGYDIRNGWNSYLVLADINGIAPGCPVGYSDGCFE